MRWVTPHNFTQHIPEGVDFRVMLTFFEFYETLLSFVLYKLYGELGVRYPLPTTVRGVGATAEEKAANTILHPTLGGKATSVLAANLTALQLALNEVSRGTSAVDAVKDAQLQNNDNERGDDANVAGSDVSKATKKKQKKLMMSIDEALKGVKDDDDGDAAGSGDDDMDEDEDEQVPISAPLREALDAIDDSAMENGDGDANANIITNPEAQKRHQLFQNLTFFLSREVPRGYLELVILSYGGKVGWEGQDSPIAMNDKSITHHIVDRPKLLPNYARLPKSREYVQPQWILDCANFNFVLPIEKYGVGAALPPHLSPWVDDKEEGYVPKYKEEVERLKNGEVLEDEPEATETNGGEDGKEESSQSEDDEGVPATRVLQKNVESESSEEEEEDEEEASRKATKKKETDVSKSFIALFLM